MLNALLQKNSILSNFLEDISFGKNASFFGGGLGDKALLINSFKGLKVFITANESNAVTMAEALKKLGEKTEIYFGESFTTFNLSKNIQKELLLYKLLNNKITALVLTINSLTKNYPNPRFFNENILKIKVNQKIKIEELTSQLLKLGYKNESSVSVGGEFSKRGDVVDIFAFNTPIPIRVNFFGNEIESINTFNKENYSKIENLNECEILGDCIQNFEADELEELFENHKLSALSKEARLNYDEVKNQALSLLDSGVKNNFYNYFSSNFTSPISLYFNQQTKVFFDNPKMISQNLQNENSMLLKQYNKLLDAGLITRAHKPAFVLNSDTLNYFTKISFQHILNSNPLFSSDVFYECKTIFSDNYYGNLSALLADLRHYTENEYTAMLCFKNEFTVSNYEKILTENNFKVNIISNAEAVKQGKINLIALPVSFSTVSTENKFAVIGISKESENVKAVKKEDAVIMPSKGDYVVHSVHGIGLCEGIQKLKLTSEEKDYIVITYQDGDRLFVPCENANLVSKYKAGERAPKLNKMGGQDFEKIKNKVKESVKKTAYDLASLYKERQQLKGFKFNSDDDLQLLFESRFSFDLTPSQEEAIIDVKRDMESNKVMDRLICGDVGYGKTEVALRAIFKAVLSGKQVAFLAPTTILSSQHYNTCKTRMAEFGINIGLLNRFRNKKEQTETLKQIESGKCNIVCGTHRLLSNDIKFENLGLLIVDEEQRFGVNHKEKIKNLKKNIDVLSLSATPIPRTLHLSLIKVRDISIIDTPPEGRLPVQTFVLEYNKEIIKSAIEKEVERKGQVLIIYNRIETIFKFASELAFVLNPSLKIEVAHAKMPATELENKIQRMYEGKTDVFISTTLIENGVDLPNANTLIVYNADKLGLSQLYQLKGRVGRSDKLAYAYFTYENDNLSESSYKRLEAINQFTSLGSGYKIAMRDLEIRGAGSVLGAEQSGHMEKVGYDMYVELLNIATSELTGEKTEKKKDAIMDIELSSLIPDSYVSETERRIKIYKDFATCYTQQEMGLVLKNLENELGPVPEQVKNLSDLILLKNIASLLNINKVQITKKNCLIYFEKENFNISPSFTNLLTGFEEKTVLKFEKLPIVSIEMTGKTIKQKLKIVEKFLKSFKQLQITK